MYFTNLYQFNHSALKLDDQNENEPKYSDLLKNLFHNTDGPHPPNILYLKFISTFL